VARGEQKTEQPTGKRLREARREGRLPQSTEVPQALTLIAVLLVLPALIRRLSGTLVTGWQETLLAVDPVDPGPAMNALASLMIRSMMLLVPLVGSIAVAAVVARALLGGVHLNVHQLRPKAKVLNPFPGLKRQLSVRQLGQLGRLVAKLGALGLVTVAMWDRFLAVVFAGPASVEDFLVGMGNAVWAMLLAVLAVSVVAGGLDGGLALRRYRKDLRMTKQEVKDEARQLEANPQVKSELRARQRKLSRMRMMAEVARADVVLTNPTHLAVALRYEPDSVAPRVVAKGAGHIAARIRQIAAEAGVPVQENKPLARALFKSVEIGDVIPVQLYQAVAEILAAVYRAAAHRGVAPRAGAA
jgi:flagellar biosynthesis protein FlhB